MAAPAIPNLNTLRRGTRGGSRGGFTSHSSQVDRESIVRNTDNDAATSRVSAVESGYLDDPFAKFLTESNSVRRLPLMNRGTYIRTTAIDRVVDVFLSSTVTRKQIVSLGAGSDTRYFRLKRESKHQNFVYHEVDFRQNNQQKIARLQASKCAQLIRQECDVDVLAAEAHDGELKSTEYCIHAIDLRALPAEPNWLDMTLPTLLISECCLIYLNPSEADKVISYFSDMFAQTPLAIVIYEPFRPDDPFGRTMIRNLTTRGITLQTIEKYSDIEQQKKRLAEQKFNARAQDTFTTWQDWIAQEQKERVERLEWLDEIEEFELLARHYCVAWGWRGFENDSIWQALSKSSQ